MRPGSTLEFPGRAAAVLLLVIVAGGTLSAQEHALQSYNERRDRVTLAAMSVLAAWSAINLASGTTLWLTSDDPERSAFHQMNAGWNIVNAGLAVPALIGATRRLADPPLLTFEQSLTAQNRLEDTLLFNAGIDFAYIAAGFYLRERALRGEPNADQLAGFGSSLILQGGFLLGFDVVVYALQRAVGRDLLETAAEFVGSSQAP